MNFTFGNWFSWAFKTLKPMSFWGSTPGPPGGTQLFFQGGVCSLDFRSVGLANWYLPLKEGACELKISKSGDLRAEFFFQIWGLWAKIWAKIEAVEAKISQFSQKGSCELTLLLEMGPLWTTGEAWKGGFSGPHIPYPFLGQCPPGLDPWCHDGISNENGTNWQFSAKLHVNVTPDLTL